MTDTIRARDGVILAADWFEAHPARAVVLMAPAMGVKRAYYARFARFLAERGATVLVPDYRGIGGSRRGSLREEPADLLTWAEMDLGGALDALRARHPGLPIRYVAHSVGGQLLGFIPDSGVDRALFVASQMGHWRLWDRGRTFMFLFWHLYVPVLTALFGRLPMSLFRAGEDVPPGVARQWARWGRDRRYLLSESGRTAGFASWDGTLHSWAIEDDTYAPPRSVDALADVYTGAAVTRRHIRPSDAGLSRLGHFGFFRPEAAALWPEAADALLG